MQIEAAVSRGSRLSAKRLPDRRMPNSPKNRADIDTIAGLLEAIRALPSDPEMPKGTPGYNRYTTQRAHWLGWLGDTPGTGSYERRARGDEDAKRVYNRIVEPKMLMWLAQASGVDSALVGAAKTGMAAAQHLASQSKAVRKHVSYSVLADAPWVNPAVSPRRDRG